jgi:homoserine kinase
VVPEELTMTESVATVGRAASLAVGMCRSDPDLVGGGMDDSVVTPARASLIEGYDEVREAALEAGAAGVTVSGAGPAVLAACGERDRQPIAIAMLEAFDAVGVDARVYQTRVGEGVTVY